MIDKIMPSIESALDGIKDGVTLMIGGFGQAGTPFNLVQALVEYGVRDLTVISNSISQASPLVENKLVKKLIASFPVWVDRKRPNPLDEQVASGEIELVNIAQGTLAEAIRAGGAGIPAFYTPTGVGTFVEEQKEKRMFHGRKYLLELALKADVALVKAYKGDRMGNLVFHMTARNFNSLMATAAELTIAEVDEIVDIGGLDPEVIVTPGIFVDRLVKAPRRCEWLYRKTD
jgi:3-oxoacid CoA-transferase A subunit